MSQTMQGAPRSCEVPAELRNRRVHSAKDFHRDCGKRHPETDVCRWGWRSPLQLPSLVMLCSLSSGRQEGAKAWKAKIFHSFFHKLY